MDIRNRSGTGGILPETQTEIYQIPIGKRIHLSEKPGPEWILSEPDPNIRSPRPRGDVHLFVSRKKPRYFCSSQNKPKL